MGREQAWITIFLNFAGDASDGLFNRCWPFRHLRIPPIASHKFSIHCGATTILQWHSACPLSMVHRVVSINCFLPATTVAYQLGVDQVVFQVNSSLNLEVPQCTSKSLSSVMATRPILSDSPKALVPRSPPTAPQKCGGLTTTARFTGNPQINSSQSSIDSDTAAWLVSRRKR